MSSSRPRVESGRGSEWVTGSGSTTTWPSSARPTSWAPVRSPVPPPKPPTWSRGGHDRPPCSCVGASTTVGIANAARLILQAIGRIDPFDYQLGGFLEELLHEGVTSAALQTAATQMVNDLTSVVRTRSLVNALQGGAGLPVAFAQEAVQACPLDNGTLDPLLALFAQLHQAGGAAPGVGVGTVCSQLLTNGQATGPLVAAVQQVPDLLTTVARATAVIAFRQAGGTDADAAPCRAIRRRQRRGARRNADCPPATRRARRVCRVGPGAQGRRAR